MTEYVFTSVVRTGWHIDGSFLPAPLTLSLYHTVCVPLKGDTVFAPLDEIVQNLQFAKRNGWERLWRMSD
jgi:alpha-ketoglutarate-dependent taurine dioxygenase